MKVLDETETKCEIGPGPGFICEKCGDDCDCTMCRLVCVECGWQGSLVKAYDGTPRCEGGC